MWQSNGCHKTVRATDVIEQWMSKSNGHHRAMAVTALAVTEHWTSQSKDFTAKGCHQPKDADAKGCHRMSQQRDVKAGIVFCQ